MMEANINKNNSIEKMNHGYLVNIAEKWLKKRCGVVLRELVAECIEIPDAIGFRALGSILVECKTSRSDFLADLKKPFRVNPEIGVGMYRFYMCPKDLIKIEELPEKWGLLYVSEKGRVYQQCGYTSNVLGQKNDPWIFEYSIIDERKMLYSALRRLNI